MSEWPPSTSPSVQEPYNGIRVDYDKLMKDGRYAAEVAPLLVNQLKEVGFVIVDVDQEVAQCVKKANTCSREFFEGNSEVEKWRCSLRTEGIGFSYFGGKCTRQGFTVHLPSKGQPFPWPEYPEPFPDQITEYFNFLQKVGTTLLTTISTGREEPTDSLTQYLDQPTDKLPYSNSVLFARFYENEKITPSCVTTTPLPTTHSNEAESAKGEVMSPQIFWPKDHTREHTDSGILTIKPLSEIAALQIMRWSDRKWVDAEVTPTNPTKQSLVVLVGEELAFLTHSYFHAAIHRVAFRDYSKTTRVSLPFQLRGNRDRFPAVEYHNPRLKLIAISMQ